MSEQTSVNRRTFLKAASAASIGVSMARAATGATAAGRIIGANDRINLGAIGVGGRGSYDAWKFAQIGEKNNSCQIVAVADVYEKRRREVSEKLKCKGVLDYHDVLAMDDLDGVIVATPDHWHAQIAMEAMGKGKDVYLEKPMVHKVEEIKQLVDTVKESKRVLQVGSQTTSADQWWKARKAIADGMIGQMVMSQGSYHRNSIEGEWNWEIDPGAGPDGKGDNFIDWKMWLGPAQQRAFDADRFFRFRKYWDYSGGIATDLFYHVAAPLNICWGEAQFPYKVMSGGEIAIFKTLPDGKPDREVPDTFHLIAEYAKGHSLVLSSSMANSQHIPGLIRGHEGTIVMVEHGMFERETPFITVKPEVIRSWGSDAKGPTAVTAEYQKKFGLEPFQIAVEQGDMDQLHKQNFLDCMRSREKPHLDVETGARAQAVISLAVHSYRQGQILYWDEQNWKAVTTPPARA